MRAAAIFQQNCASIDHVKLALAVKVEGCRTKIGCSKKSFLKSAL
jgi:hypothetical protein